MNAFLAQWDTTRKNPAESKFDLNLGTRGLRTVIRFSAHIESEDMIHIHLLDNLEGAMYLERIEMPHQAPMVAVWSDGTRQAMAYTPFLELMVERYLTEIQRCTAEGRRYIFEWHHPAARK